MEQNDHDRAMRNVEAIFGLGRQAANNPIFVCVLVGAAVQGDGMGLIEELVDEHLETLSNEELKRLQKIMADADFSSMSKINPPKRNLFWIWCNGSTPMMETAMGE